MPANRWGTSAYEVARPYPDGGSLRRWPAGFRPSAPALMSRWTRLASVCTGEERCYRSRHGRHPRAHRHHRIRARHRGYPSGPFARHASAGTGHAHLGRASCPDRGHPLRSIREHRSPAGHPDRRSASPSLGLTFRARARFYRERGSGPDPAEEAEPVAAVVVDVFNREARHAMELKSLEL